MDDVTKTAVYKISRTGTVTAEISYANVIPSAYRPYSAVRVPAHNGSNTIKLVIGTDGTVLFTGGTASNSITMICQVAYNYGIS